MRHQLIKTLLAVLLLIMLTGCDSIEELWQDPVTPDPNPEYNNEYQPPADSQNENQIISATVYIQDTQRFGTSRSGMNEPIELVINIAQPEPDNPSEIIEQSENLTTTTEGTVTLDNLNEGPISLGVHIPEWDDSYSGTAFLVPGHNQIYLAQPGSFPDFTFRTLILLFGFGPYDVLDNINWQGFIDICKYNYDRNNSPVDTYYELSQGNTGMALLWEDFSEGDIQGNFVFETSGGPFIGKSGYHEYHFTFDNSAKQTPLIRLRFDVYNEPTEVAFTLKHLTKRSTSGNKHHSVSVWINGMSLTTFYNTGSDWYEENTYTTTWNGSSLASFISPGENEIIIEGDTSEPSEYWIKFIQLLIRY